MEFPRTTFRLAAAGIILFSTVTVPVADAMDTRSGKDPKTLADFHQTGKASWYGGGFHGKETASGTPFNQHALTAAHRSLPLGTEVLVTNMDNGKSITVTINDRGPYVRGRIIDLSRRAARDLGFVGDGLAKVAITMPPPAENVPPPVPQAKPDPAPATGNVQVAAVPDDDMDEER